MLRLLVRRLRGPYRWLLAASMVTFLSRRLLPGDPARALLGQNATAEQLAAARQQLGLNQPLWLQYWNWLVNAVHGDLGTSLISQTPVDRTAEQPTRRHRSP